MIEAWCDNCGARFEVDDSMGGKKAKCARCKTVLTIPEADILLATDPALDIAGANDYDAEPLEAVAIVDDEQGPDAPITLDMARENHFYESIDSREMEFDDDPRSFWGQLPGCFVFALKWPNVIYTIVLSMLGIFMVVMPVLGMMGCIFLSVQVGAWFFMLFCIIRGTCNNEDRLTTIFTDFDLVESFRALGGIIFSVFWSALPAVAIAWPILHFSSSGELKLLASIISTIVYFYLWPMVLLTIALFGVDLPALWYLTVLRQTFKTFSKYIITCLLVTGCYMAMYLILAIKPGVLDLFTMGLTRSISIVYFSFTATRIIGVYYRTCKNKLEL